MSQDSNILHQFWDPIKSLPNSVTSINNTGKGLQFIDRIINSRILDTTICSSPEVGKLYWFYYVPDEMKRYRYWDSMPLVIVTDVSGTTFTGINLHYIPNKYRIDISYTIISNWSNNKNLSDNCRILIKSHEVKGLPNSRQLVHQYKLNNLKTNMYEIDGSSWGAAIALPLADFKVANRNAPLTEVNRINWQDVIYQPRISLILAEAKKKK